MNCSIFAYANDLFEQGFVLFDRVLFSCSRSSKEQILMIDITKSSGQSDLGCLNFCLHYMILQNKVFLLSSLTVLLFVQTRE